MEIRSRRYIIIADWNKDEWNGFAALLANLIEKYAAVLDIEHLPEPPNYLGIGNDAISFENTERAIEKEKTA